MMGRWVRADDTEMPEMIRVNFGINTRKHPQLAAYLHSLPFGSQSETIRAILEQHLGIDSDAQANVVAAKRANIVPVVTNPARNDSTQKSPSSAEVKSITSTQKVIPGVSQEAVNTSQSGGQVQVMDSETADWMLSLEKELG